MVRCGGLCLSSAVVTYQSRYLTWKPASKRRKELALHCIISRAVSLIFKRPSLLTYMDKSVILPPDNTVPK